MSQPKPISRKYEEILRNVKNGVYQIPKFQRDFVWEKGKVASLIDSIFKGYPIGSFILWKTKERLKAVKGLGSEIFQDIPEGDFVYYILDGQQRITSLYLAIEGLSVGGVDYSEIYVDLRNAKEWMENPDSDCEVITSEKPGHGLFLTLSKLVKERTSKLRRRLADSTDMDRDELEDVIDDVRDRIKGYEFSTIEIEDMPLGRVIEIFTRINTSGKTLTLFEIMNAKVYTEQNGEVLFDLEEKFNELIEQLRTAGYETIGENRTLILQLIALILKKNAKRRVILSLSKEEFTSVWDDAVKSLKLAIDKLRTYFRIPVSKLLPYYVLVVPLSYFYYVNDFEEPTPSQLKELEKYFFRSAFSWRFSSAVESKLTYDIKLMERIRKGESINWDKEIPTNFDRETLVEWLKEPFSTSNAFDKGVLCILAYFKPKRFSDNGDVLLDNSWLNKSTSKNYHHFFPKAFLEKKGKSEQANALVNITLVDDYLNKRKIKAKPPSKYIKEFAEQNPNLGEALRTHLIDDIEEFGVLTDDYELFLDKRSNRIADEILKRI